MACSKLEAMAIYVVKSANANGILASVYGWYLDFTEILQDGNWVQGNINNATMYMLSFWKTYSLKILLQH